MSRTQGADSRFLSRRRILQATGGLAATAVAGSRGLRGAQSARAQDAVPVTMWGNHPEWKDPMEEIIEAFQAAVPGVEIDFSAVTSDQYGGDCSFAGQIAVG